MPSDFHLGAPAVTEAEGCWIARARWWRSGEKNVAGGSEEIVFEIRGERPESDIAAFLPTAMFLAMRSGGCLRIHGELPAEWETSSRRFQEIACSIFPDLAPVELEAAWTARAFGGGEGETVVFNGDLDSFHALAVSTPARLLALAAGDGSFGPDPIADRVAERMNLPVSHIIPQAMPSSINGPHPWDCSALRVATALGFVAGKAGRVVWGSPCGWLSPLTGGDHFALLECFQRSDVPLRITGRAETTLGKWRTVATHPMAREFLRVSRPKLADGWDDEGTLALVSARLALLALGTPDGWSAVDQTPEPDARALANCVMRDRAFCEDVLKLLLRDDREPTLAANLAEALRQCRLEAWARDLYELGENAARVPLWPKLARRLLSVVLATAAARDRAWLRELAVTHGSMSLSSHD